MPSLLTGVKSATMNYFRLKIWIIVTITFAIVAVVIRSIWQVVVIPTPGTMRIFIPLIFTLLGLDAIIIYLALNPQRFKSLPIVIGTTVVITAGLVAGVSHFVHFIISPQADPALCKVIGAFVLLSSLSAYAMSIWFIWSLRRKSAAKG